MGAGTESATLVEAVQKRLRRNEVFRQRWGGKESLAPPACADDLKKIDEVVVLPGDYRALLVLHDGWKGLEPDVDLMPSARVLAEYRDRKMRKKIRGLGAQHLLIGWSAKATVALAIDPSGRVTRFDTEDDDAVYASLIDYLDERQLSTDGFPGLDVVRRWLEDPSTEVDADIAARFAGVKKWPGYVPVDVVAKFLWRAAKIEAIAPTELLDLVTWGGPRLAALVAERDPDLVMARFGQMSGAIAWAGRLAAKSDPALVDTIIAALSDVTRTPVLKPKAAEEAHGLCVALLASRDGRARAAIESFTRHANAVGERTRALQEDIASRL